MAYRLEACSLAQRAVAEVEELFHSVQGFLSFHDVSAWPGPWGTLCSFPPPI